ncbi:ty3-gypsy retrotransposon protein [Cucumis melo var. makuwa]|uniref:Ty3-gypsy retrotransposon protein n=1 Tax=Cucumis melo var. makuwa TaxID=1194695 RepID=A0A5A7T3A5_CUCMM|nr:ty3-gypsy retrotransposon protein [Cucumis melo var. makuwa]TYK07516.1 ty3-gypsy retrotransposon protein [Cucumis melo var. makuwa]
MTLKNSASKSSVANDAYTGPITRIRSKGIIKEQDQENPLYDNSDSTSSKTKKEAHPNVMSIMMVDITVEAAMVKMERKVNFQMKVVEEKDHEITALREQMQTRETAESRIKPRTFEDLATSAHDMEWSIANRGTKDFPVSEVRKDKKETKSVEKVVKSTVKESMVVNTTPLKFSKRKEGIAEKKDDGSERQRLTLKERQ